MQCSRSSHLPLQAPDVVHEICKFQTVHFSFEPGAGSSLDLLAEMLKQEDEDDRDKDAASGL